MLFISVSNDKTPIDFSEIRDTPNSAFQNPIVHGLFFITDSKQSGSLG